MQSQPIKSIVAVLIVAALPLQSTIAQATARVSVDSLGLQGNQSSREPAISSDGRYVAFESDATNLVPGHTSGIRAIYVHDRSSGETSCVSVNGLGVSGNDTSSSPAISADGRYVTFSSRATNLVPGDSGGHWDVFVHDRLHRSTERISVNAHGAGGNGESAYPTLSADGRYVAFESDAGNLVPGDSNGVNDIFVHDRETGLTRRVSVDSQGFEGNSRSAYGRISADGTYIAFQSLASNLVPQDMNSALDIFERDLRTGQTRRISLATSGMEGNGTSANAAISADGRYVAFHSWSNNLVPGDSNLESDIFVRDRQLDQTARVSVDSFGGEANDRSLDPSISSDGRFVAFFSDATNLVVGDGNHDPDVFVHDRATGLTTRVSVNSLGVEGNHGGRYPSITADGRFVAFDSSSTDLVPGDTNRVTDVFVRDRGPDSGATIGTIVLAADLDLAVHQAAKFSWFAAPPDASYWLLASAQDQGTVLGGHPFGLGPGFRIMDTGRISARGTGILTTAPFPTWTQGRTVYVEVAARDAGGLIYDSNTLERTVQ
jgi:Tol biopolymer transport system component